jgi:hypothetical protein
MRSNGKMSAMKTAARDLINILYGAREEVQNFWVGLVPYVATVNIGADRTDWLMDYDPADYQPTTWKGCVEARAYPNDTNDAPPSEEPWRPHLWRSTLGEYQHDGVVLGGDNDWDPDGGANHLHEDNAAENNGTGPNLGCGPPITPLLAGKADVLDAIDEMAPWHRGGTMANQGLAWGWRVLSPRWRGLWGGDTPNNLPLDYRSPNMSKVAVLLTDGVNEWYDWPGNGGNSKTGLPGQNSHGGDSATYQTQFPGADYTAYGRLTEGRLGTTNNAGATTVVNERMLELCTAMKAQDIILYTITVQVNNATTRQLFEDCATSPAHYFNSPSIGDLAAAFHQIADELTNLRIAE